MGSHKKTSVPPEERIKRTKRAILISASLLLAAVMIFGAGIGIVTFVRDRRAVVRYGGVTVDRGVASYLASTYKSTYMAANPGARDTEEYWGEYVGDKTRGEFLSESTEEYVRAVVASAYLFDRYATLTGEEKNAIKRTTEYILSDRAGGDEGKFNEDTKKYGFDYSDLCRAAELLYKSDMAKSVIYGTDGANLTNLTDAAVLNECNRYFAEYSRVKLLYIDTRETVVKGSDGKIELDGGGSYKTRYLNEAEKAARLADITEIRRLIEGDELGVGDEMSPEYFDLMQDKYNISSAYNSSGYYLSAASAFSAGLADGTVEYLPEGAYKLALHKMMGAAVETALVMNEGEYREIEGDFGVIFIYKCEREEGAYLSSSLDSFFHDFFSDAADYLYRENILELMKGVDVREKYHEIDLVKIPYNYAYKVKIG